MLKLAYTGVKQIFIASEAISHLAAVVYSAEGIRYIEAGEDATAERACGILYGAVTSTFGSGKICRVVTEGIVSGVLCGVQVQAGDRLICTSTGHIMPLNAILPTVVSGPISLAIASGFLSGVMSSFQGPFSGAVVVASGVAMGTAFNTGNVFAKALASGVAGAGIPILVG